jgi:hypothetical protein
MTNTSRNHFPVLCCHRASFSRPFAIPAAVGCPDADASFLQRSTWAEFRAVLAGLRDQCPTAMPVVVRTSWLPETILGQCIRRWQRFVVRLNENMGEPQAVEVLCHEWAHALAWNFAVDRLINAPDTDPIAFERVCHDEAWGCAYSRVWRAYLDVIREAA